MIKYIILSITTISLAIILIFSVIPKDTITHKNSVAKYSIEFPKNWKVLQGVTGDDLIAIAPRSDPQDLFRENANILSDLMEFPLEKEKYYSLNIESLSNLLEDFDLEEIIDVKINGFDAKKITFTHTMGIINTRVIQYLFIVESRAYVLNFTADHIDFKKYYKQFDQIAHTFKIES